VQSGIQEPSGGVARYYRTDLLRNRPVSTEITGYAVSALLHLNEKERAVAAAEFLCNTWNGQAMPFETGSRLTYFFDCGIIVRGLVAAWRAIGAPRYLEVASAIGKAMAADFATGEGGYHPALQLPEKRPVEGDPLRWSLWPGCYQLKSAMAWWDLAEITGDSSLREAYQHFLGTLLTNWRAFPEHPDPLKTVDRLHAFLYFLEALLPMAQERRCAATLCEGIRLVPEYQQRTAEAGFERSDVFAQLLRIRIYAAWAGAAPLDREAAGREAGMLAEFQAASTDQRIDGGFYFGRKAGEWMAYVNPVSTAFGAQSLSLWDRYCNGGAPAEWQTLI